MNNNDAAKHGAVLAEMFGWGDRYVSTTVLMGSSETDKEESSVAVYPKSYVGMGGGMMRAEMEGAPVFHFPAEDEDEAKRLVAALNYFADIAEADAA